jgi:hypothetical protein
MSGQHGIEGVPPLLIFFLRHRQLLSPSTLAGGLWVERPDLLRQQAQRDPIGRDSQGAMNEPPLTGTTTQRSQALGGSQAAPVGLGRILRPTPGEPV